MPVGAVVHRFESVPSTNDVARTLALHGAAHGTAVIAREQTRGRGTKGRVWHSPAGLWLYAFARKNREAPLPFEEAAGRALERLRGAARRFLHPGARP